MKVINSQIPRNSASQASFIGKQGLKIDLESAMLPMLFLFISGIFTGIAIMLAL
jgi:hypothetical protein